MLGATLTTAPRRGHQRVARDPVDVDVVDDRDVAGRSQQARFFVRRSRRAVPPVVRAPPPGSAAPKGADAHGPMVPRPRGPPGRPTRNCDLPVAHLRRPPGPRDTPAPDPRVGRARPLSTRDCFVADARWVAHALPRTASVPGPHLPGGPSPRLRRRVLPRRPPRISDPGGAPPSEPILSLSARDEAAAKGRRRGGGPRSRTARAAPPGDPGHASSTPPPTPPERGLRSV